MPDYKITLFFNLDQQGWTESFYRENVHDALLATQLQGNTLPIWDWRAVGTQLFAIRASNVALPRDTYTRFIGATVGPVYDNANNLLNGPDPATTCALTRIETGFPQRRFIWLRGLQDRQVNRSITGTSTPSPQLTQAITRYANFIARQLWAVRFLQPAAGNYVWTPVVQVARNAINPAWTDVTLFAALPSPPFSAGARIYFKGVPKRVLPYLTGSYPAYQSAGNPTVYTIHYNMLEAGPVLPTGMQARLQAYQYLPITSLQFEEFREHLTGRPTVRYRGRRSASRVAH